MDTLTIALAGLGLLAVVGVGIACVRSHGGSTDKEAPLTEREVLESHLKASPGGPVVLEQLTAPYPGWSFFRATEQDVSDGFARCWAVHQNGVVEDRDVPQVLPQLLMQVAGAPPIQAEPFARAVGCLLAPEGVLITGATLPMWQNRAGDRTLEPPTWTEGPPHKLLFWLMTEGGTELERHIVEFDASGTYTHQVD